MKVKAIVYEILRWAAVAAGVVMLVMMFGSDPISSADINAVESAVTEKLDMSAVLPADNLMIRRLYGIDPEAYEGCVLYYPSTNMVAQELLIVKLSDISQQETLLAAIEARLQTQKTSFDGYGIEQYDMLTNNCVIEPRGNYVLFVVDPASADARQAFLDAL
jgi:hypothetical protein